MVTHATLAYPTFRVGTTEKVLIWLIILSLLLQSLVTVLPQPVPISSGEIAATDTPVVDLPPVADLPIDLPAELVGKREITALRTANSATFELGDGQFATLQDTQPLHYADGNGNWQPINPTFQQIAGSWINNSNSVRTGVGQRTSVATIAGQEIGLEFRPQALEWSDDAGSATTVARLAEQPEPGQRSSDGHTIRYAQSWQPANQLPLLDTFVAAQKRQSIQDQWQSAPGQTQYTMRLDQLPAHQLWQRTPAALDLRVQLTLQPGTTLLVDGKPFDLSSDAAIETGRPLVFRSAHGEELLLQPPASYEQANRTNSIQGSYLVHATTRSQAIELHVRTPYTWLAAPERQFPVVIDPLFQIRGTTQIAEAYYDPNTLQYSDTIVGSNGAWVGRLPGKTVRALLRFEMPKMPANTTVSKAYLLIAPNNSVVSAAGKIIDGGLNSKVTLHSIQPGSPEWWNGADGAPVINLNAPLAPGEVSMSYSAGQESPAYTQWDVTGIVQSWNNTTVFEPDNFGLMLRTTNEQCAADNVFPIDPLCGAFSLQSNPDDWTTDELILTQNLSNPDAPFIPNNATTRGVRLVVYYSGPTLSEGVSTTPGLGALPKADLPPYYSADHVYTIPQLPSNKWQAVVSRGFAPSQGPTNPSQTGINNAYRAYLRGSFPMKVQINDSKSGAQLLDRTLGSVTPVSGEAGYLLLDGRGTPTQYTDTPLQLRVSNATSNPQPIGYDAELVGEQPQAIAPTVGVVKQVDYEFDSAEPLALWNLVLPANSTSRVSIRITGDGTRPASYRNLFAASFRAQVAHSSSQQTMPTSTGETATVAQWSLAANTTSSNFITSEAGQYALAVAYHGPRLTVYDEEDCGKEFCNSTVIPIKYTMQIKVLSCAAGEFPTQGGSCQKVECPNSSWVFNSTTFQDAGGMRIWSKSGFNRNGSSGDTINSTIAPLIGPTGGSPTVAVVGGKVSYTTPNTLQLSVDSTVMLVKCPALNAANGTPTAWFDLFDGAMERQIRPFNQPVLAPAPAGSGQVKNTPWASNDKTDLSSTDFYVDGSNINASSAVGRAVLNRTVGDSPETANLKFNVSWSLKAEGWSTLSSSITADAANPAPPPVASLLVNLGSSFSLDTTPANGNQPRSFTAVRAAQATVTQQAKLGGASKAVQAVILPRNLPIKEISKSCTASCLDLRGVNDAANLPAPDRRWEMPDILTNVDAKTVIMSSEGNLTVYSSDHPNFENATSNFSKEFNFSAGKAKVSIGFEPCGGVGPDVVVINGEAEIKVPNVDAQLGASFMLCVSEDGAGLRSVHMSFESPVGIPLGQTGMFLTGLHGGVDIFPDYTKITVGISIQAAPGGNGGALKITGEVSIDTRGLFELQATGKVLGTVDITGKLWVSWSPLDTGFEVKISYKDWLEGLARAHLWQGQGWQHRYSWLPDDDTMHFTGTIAATIKIKEGQIGELGPIKLPPSNISIKIEVSFGEFCVSADCTVFEWGIKGRVEVAGYGVGIYYGFDSGFDFVLGTDNHLLIDQYGGSQLLAAAADQVAILPAPAQVNGTALVSLTVTAQSEEILVTLGWQAGSPSLSLINPDGVEINAANANQFQAQVYSEGSQALMTVKMPKAGTWQAKISNLSDAGVEHYKLVFLSNKGAPGTPGNRGSFISPAAANEPGNSSYKLRWSAPDDAPISTTVSLYYYPTLLSSGVLSGNLQVGAPIVKNLAFKAGEFDWDTTGLLNGTYQIRAEVDDGINALPIGQISQPLDSCLPDYSGLTNERAYDPNRFAGTEVFTSTGTIMINDVTAPAAPTGLQLYPGDGALMARWNAAPEKDVSQYLVSWGPRSGNGFTDANHALVTASALPEYRLGAVTNGVEYGINVVALDANENVSAAGTTQFATPNPGGNEIPSAPLTPTLVSATSNSVSINITAGSGATPTQYRVEVTRLDSKGTQTHSDFVNANPTISGLETGVSYSIRVAAGNSDNWFGNYSPALQVLVTNGVDNNHDGMADDWAIAFGVSDANADSDNDGLKNGDEFKAGTNPKVQDSDGDDFSDGEEQAAGTDPTNSASYGSQYTQPRLQLVEDVLSFQAKKQAGGAAATQSVQWANVGGGNFIPQLSSEESWIQATLVGDTVQVGVDQDSLEAGYYSGILKLGGAAGSDPLMGGAQCIRVNTWILPADDDTGGRPVAIYLPIVSR